MSGLLRVIAEHDRAQEALIERLEMEIRDQGAMIAELQRMLLKACDANDAKRLEIIMAPRVTA